MAAEKSPAHENDMKTGPPNKFIDIESQSQSNPSPYSGTSLSGNAWQQRQHELGNTVPVGTGQVASPARTSPMINNTTFHHHTSQPISRKERVGRKIHSVFSIIFFIAAVHPFKPISWLLPFGGYGAEIADWLVADFALACACYFHFRIALLDEDLVVDFPSFGGLLPGRTTIRGGHVMTDAGPVPSWVYRPEWYWRVWIVEWAVLGTVHAYREEYEVVRRVVAVVVVVGWWYIGWPATPRRYKDWAWGYVKQFWGWMLASRIFRGGWVGVMRFGR